MSCILHIETSTSACSVAVSEDGQNVFNKEDLNGPSHAALLGVFIDEALSFADSHAMPIDAVAVSCGPGSYTGLRIGVSMAKGVCYGRNIPLIGLPTLKVQCVPVLLYHDELPEDALLCPMIDARRMEVYAAIYDRALKPVRDIAADIVDENSYTEFLDQHPVYFFGDGAAKCKDKITHPNAHFIDDIRPLAKMMFPLAEKAIAENDFKDVAYFEPFYLKEFVASQPKKLLYYMQYNTQQKRMPLPEYGRSIQNMVDHALTIEDRAERQRCANTIINIMGNMFPHLRDVPDFKHKLWDHLAIMSDFKLDIDYPYEIIRKDNLNTRPEVIPYPSTKIRYRHYGRTLEVLIKKAIDFPEGDEKQNLIALICNHMKKDYMTWNKDTVDDRKIAEDLNEYSGGKLQMTDDIIKLMAERINQNYRPKVNNQNNRRDNRNNKRKY